MNCQHASTPWVNKWTVVITLLAATTINFLDRQTLSILAPVLQKELGITTLQYAYVLNSFLSVYAVMYLLSGRLVDWLGTRRGLGFAVLWWSTAQLLHAYATDVTSLCVLRALLAFGEAAVVPSAVKAVAEWFEARERGKAVSIWEAGLSLGPMLAPPLVVWIAHHQGWRAAFQYTGTAGFILAGVWLIFYRTPAASTHVETGLRPMPGSAWVELFRSRAIWGVAITRIFGDPVWFFYLFWLPKYFNDAKHMSLSSIGAFAWIPYAAQIFGGLFGGWLADRLIRRGLPPVQARLRVMLYAMPVLSCGVLSVLTDSLPLVMLTVSIGAFALQVWGICVETLPSDIFPAERVAFGVGLCGMLGTLGGVVFTAATGYVVQHYSYSPIWVASALMFPIGWVVGWTLLRRNSLYLSGAAEQDAPSVAVPLSA